MNGLTKEEWERERARYEQQGFKHKGLGIMRKGDVLLRVYKNRRGEVAARMLDFCAIQGDLKKRRT